MIEQIVYLLCALTSLLCTVLFLRNYFEHRVALSLWTGLCFGALAVDNVLLVLDMVIDWHPVDFLLWRNTWAMLGALGLMLAMIWEES